MDKVITNNRGWHEDFGDWSDIEIQAERYEELRRLEQEYQDQGWDDEE
jgi:hypothetical protein